MDTENPIIVFDAIHWKRSWRLWTHRTQLQLFRKSSGSLKAIVGPLIKILQMPGRGQKYLQKTLFTCACLWTLVCVPPPPCKGEVLYIVQMSLGTLRCALMRRLKCKSHSGTWKHDQFFAEKKSECPVRDHWNVKSGAALWPSLGDSPCLQLICLSKWANGMNLHSNLNRCVLI